MALSEETVQDKIEVVGDHRIVQVRTARIIKSDGVEISRSFSRHIVTPSSDTSSESTEVKSICNAVHTQTVKDAYADYEKKLAEENKPKGV
jgi:hypothetical protein|tara:strand:- start:254 stop:526 length:273 start_codon:yes stop_codon:yes gene_type:complete